MNILLDNVNLQSTSGPNHFGLKLKKYLNKLGCECASNLDLPDIQLSFIETHRENTSVPIVQRLDGIYFDNKQNFKIQNKNILKTYKKAKGVVFQTEYCKNLTFKYFGSHENYAIINNGADLELMDKVEPLKQEKFSNFNNVWCCASNWYYSNNFNTPRSWKRLKENVEFFLKFSNPKDCLIVAGSVAPQHIEKNSRIFYVGKIAPKELFSIYKISKFFIHLASLDACPNVVVDARACGCRIVCSSNGGTKEIAGTDAVVVYEEPWDFKPFDLNGKAEINFNNFRTIRNKYNNSIDMNDIARNYLSFLKQNI